MDWIGGLQRREPRCQGGLETDISHVPWGSISPKRVFPCWGMVANLGYPHHCWAISRKSAKRTSELCCLWYSGRWLTCGPANWMEENCPEGGHHCAIGQGLKGAESQRRGQAHPYAYSLLLEQLWFPLQCLGKSSSSVFEGRLALAARHGLSSPGTEAASLVLSSSKAVVFCLHAVTLPSRCGDPQP